MPEKYVNIFYLRRHLKGLQLPLALSFFQKLLNSSKIKDLDKATNFV